MTHGSTNIESTDVTFLSYLTFSDALQRFRY